MNQVVEIVDFADRTTLVEKIKPQLGPHINAEKFVAVVMTAVRKTPKLLDCDRASLWTACEEAAQDGLLPDGKDGAIVPYKDRKQNKLIAQWLPMIGGLRKLAQRSGVVEDWYTEIVYDGDDWNYQKGSEPRVDHKPAPPSQRGSPIAAYSIATLTNGRKTAPEWMWIEEINAIKAKVRGNGSSFSPWNDKTFYPEMVRKTVARRHAKSLPRTDELDRALERGDAMYDLEKVVELPPEPPPVPTLAFEGPPLPVEGTLDQTTDVDDNELMRIAADPDGFLDKSDAALIAATDMVSLGEVWSEEVEPYLAALRTPDQEKARTMYEANQDRLMSGEQG